MKQINVGTALQALSGVLNLEGVESLVVHANVTRLEEGFVVATDRSGVEHQLASDLKCRLGFDPELNVCGPALCAANDKETAKIGSMIVILMALRRDGSTVARPVRWIEESKAFRFLRELETLPVARVLDESDEDQVVWIGFERDIPTELMVHAAEVKVCGGTSKFRPRILVLCPDATKETAPPMPAGLMKDIQKKQEEKEEIDPRSLETLKPSFGGKGLSHLWTALANVFRDCGKPPVHLDCGNFAA